MTVSYAIIAETARQQLIVERMKQAKYYESRFEHVLPGLRKELNSIHEGVGIYISSECKEMGNSVHHKITYEFSWYISLKEEYFKLDYFRKYITNGYAKRLEAEGFYD